MLYKYRSRNVVLRAGAYVALSLLPTTLLSQRIRKDDRFQEVDVQAIPLM